MTISHPAPRRTPAPGARPTALAHTPERGPSLYELALESRTIAGEIAIAADLLGSDDPEELNEAIGLMEQYLLAEETNKAAIDAKADNICHVIDAIAAKAAFRKTEAKRLKELAEEDERRVERLTSNMLRILQTLRPGERKFSLPLHEITSRTSDSVVITNADDLPEDLLRTTAKSEPDKAAIKAAIKGGNNVPGAALVRNLSWQIK